ncbi:hypothetical protein [Methylocella silvestris]|uniref:Lipoprotein n=1 Tax=Methylocella silvestris TaxID=199596 RepID=A0A2J7TKS7_METSI|nr:hypothetical protein [Methylocella silvestris]PNG27374.1 hypothetical protein CR492_04485 [Methylocella silvestris]
MRKIGAFASCFIALAACAAPATAAEKCPVSDAAAEKAGGYANAVNAAVKDARNCEQAYRALAACQLGSSADNPLSDIVRSKCEPLFMGRANPATKQSYKKALQRCDKIAERNEGSMYQGFAAVCQAGAARDFARKDARQR